MNGTPATDAKERETRNQKATTRAYYGWKQARRMERELRKLEVKHSDARDALRELLKWTEHSTDTRICPVSLLRAMNRARAICEGPNEGS